jgi:hypothetical protein
MRLKRWEYPRREGRNDKGKKSSARQRQLKKQTQVLRRKLKGEGERSHSLLSFWAVWRGFRKVNCLAPSALIRDLLL